MSETIEYWIEHDITRATCLAFAWPLLILIKLISSVKLLILTSCYNYTLDEAKTSCRDSDLIQNWFIRGSYTQVLN